jgi:putative FmdB family regulatory protein
MPTYQYRCKSCAHEFDQFQKFSDDPLTICPVCGQEIRRVIQPVGVVFKGSGWYINDSRPASSESNGSGAKSDAKPAAEKSEAKADAKSDANSETKTEAKSESKSESKETKAAVPA